MRKAMGSSLLRILDVPLRPLRYNNFAILIAFSLKLPYRIWMVKVMLVKG